jgi:hypothetical protein
LTNQDIKQVREAFGNIVAKMTTHPMEVENAVKFTTFFKDRNAEPFTFFAYRRPKQKKIYLTDLGGIVKTLEKSGTAVQLGLLQKMLNSYGLTFTDHKDVVEMTNRPLGHRVAALFQAWSAADGVLRMWTLPK